MGGPSAERQISLESGRAIAAALRRSRIDVDEVVWDGDLLSQLSASEPDRVFIALHGRGGEDGTVQGLLELLKLPYTGSGVLGCALSMDKVRSKHVWRSLGLPTPPFAVFHRDDAQIELAHDLGYPVMVKPAREGSSFGASRVDSSRELESALAASLEYDDVALIERWVTGGEFTLGVLEGQALPIIKLETPRGFYDFEAKYIANTTRYLCPCGLSQELIERCTTLGVNAFEALGASGWGRVDFMLDEHDNPWLIELNTVPGMTDHSLVPMAANADGIGFDDLVVRILSTSFGDGA